MRRNEGACATFCVFAVKAQTPTVSGSSSLTDGDSTTLTCASASSSLSGETYEWYENGILVSGATSSTYTKASVSMSDDGKAYTCKVIFNSVTSDVSSNSVTLTGEYTCFVSRSIGMLDISARRGLVMNGDESVVIFAW